MDINLYDDNTYTITCPAFGNAVAVKGTYTMKNGVLTLSAKAEDIKYIPNANRTSVEFTVSADLNIKYKRIFRFNYFIICICKK